MATLLKRLSMSLDKRMTSGLEEEWPNTAKSASVAASPSFNDFSMHVGQEGALNWSISNHTTPEHLILAFLPHSLRIVSYFAVDEPINTSGNKSQPQTIPGARRSLEPRPASSSPFNVGSAPAGMSIYLPTR